MSSIVLDRAPTYTPAPVEAPRAERQPRTRRVRVGLVNWVLITCASLTTAFVAYSFYFQQQCEQFLQAVAQPLTR